MKDLSWKGNSNMKKLKSVWGLLDNYCTEPIEDMIGLYDIQYDVSMKIYNYRSSKKWSQKKLAEILGISQAMVSKLESGEYNFTIEQLWKISSKLGWDLSISFEESTSESYSVSYDSTSKIDSIAIELVG